MASCLEEERHRIEVATEKECEDVEAVTEVPESVVLQELQGLGNSLLDGKAQSSKDQVQMHKKQDECTSPVRAESDKETGLPGDFVKERSEFEASHGQIECTAKELVELMGPTCGIESMPTTPTESVEAPMTECRSEDKEPELVTKGFIQENTQVENQDNQAFVEAKADANKPLDLLNNAGTVEVSDEKLDLASVQSPEISVCFKESRASKSSKYSHRSSLQKRKVVFNFPDEVGTEHQSCMSLSVESSRKGLRRSCRLNSMGAEHISSIKIMDVEASMVNKTFTTKQKGKQKKTGRLLLPKNNRSTIPKVKYEGTEDGKVVREVCNEQGLEAGSTKRKSATRMRNSTDGQDDAILSQPLSPNKTAQGVASMTASLEAGSKRRKSTTRVRNSTDGQDGALLSQPCSPSKTAEGEASMTASLEAGSKRQKSITEMRNSTDGQDSAISSQPLSPNKTAEGEASIEAGSKRRKMMTRMTNSTDGQDGVILSEPSSPNKTAEGDASMTALLEAGSKRWKSTTRMRNSTDRQDGAILSLPLSPKKTAEGEVSMTALLEAGSNRRKNTTRMRNSTDGQDGAILSQPLSPNKTAEGEASMTALLEAVSKRRKIMTRKGNSTDGQDGAILSQPFCPIKTAEGEVSMAASVLEAIINRRAKKQKGVNEKSHVKKAAQKKTTPKKKSGCLARLQHMLKQARVYNDPTQMESYDPVISMIAIQKEETKSNISLEVGIRKRKSGGADFDIHLDTSKHRKAKPLKEIDTGDSTCASGKGNSEGYHSKPAHIESDSGLSSMTSARKRLKQILPPPLPLPLVSVSKQLVSKAFGLKTSRSGRLLVPPLAHWRGQSLVRDMDGGIIAIEGGSQDATKEDTGCFTFKPPTEARAKKLQKWLCETAAECWTKKLNSRKKASDRKQKRSSN